MSKNWVFSFKQYMDDPVVFLMNKLLGGEHNLRVDFVRCLDGLPVKFENDTVRQGVLIGNGEEMIVPRDWCREDDEVSYGEKTYYIDRDRYFDSYKDVMPEENLPQLHTLATLLDGTEVRFESSSVLGTIVPTTSLLNSLNGVGIPDEEVNKMTVMRASCVSDYKIDMEVK